MKRRSCLRCGDTFNSHGPANRCCPICAGWMRTEDCPYSDGNYLYAITSEDAVTIQARRQVNAANAKHLHKKGA